MDYGALESLFGEAVTTSVTGSPQRAGDVPASMIIITAEDIRRSGARDIPGVLRHVPGVDVLQWTNDQADVAVRGHNQAQSPRLLVLVDGRQVYADHYGYTPWSAVPVELPDIRQIEIVMGTNSALFGFNAVDGVINIVTYDPLYDDVNTASIRGGTQGLVQGSAITTFRIDDDAGLRISLGGHRADDFSSPQRAGDLGTRRGDDRKAIDVLGHARFKHGIDVSLELSHSEASEPEISPLYTTFYTPYRTNSLKLFLSAETDAGILQLTAYRNWFKAVQAAPDPLALVYKMDNEVSVVQLQDIFKIGNDHIFRISGEYRHNALKSTPLAGADVSYGVLAGGAMWAWTIQPDLTLTNSIRVDYLTLGRSGLIPPGFGLSNSDWNGRSLTEVSFNSGIVWKPDSADALRLTVARGVQVPNLLNLGGLLFALPVGYVSGVPYLKPTIVMNYGLDWDHALPAFDTRLKVRLFYQASRDLLANFGGIAPALNIFAAPTNIGRSAAMGAEISLGGTTGDWRWGISYTPEVIADHFAPGFNVTNALVDYEHTNPVHVVNANLGWARDLWEIDGYLRYESQFDSIQGVSSSTPGGTLVRIPDYVSMDARIAYRMTDHLTLAVSGQNLLQSPQRQTSAPEVERRVYLTVTANL